MKKLFALMLVFSALAVIGCSKAEDTTTTTPSTTETAPADGTETEPMDKPAEPAAP